VGGGAHRQRPGRKASTSLSCSPSGKKATWEKAKRYGLGWLQRWAGPEEKGAGPEREEGEVGRLLVCSGWVAPAGEERMGQGREREPRERGEWVFFL
jgi:hypothetical protein